MHTWLVAAAMILAVAAMAHVQDTAAARPFQGRRIVSTFTQTIDALPERVFPLLCPIRESEWAAGWTGKVIFARTGVAEEDGLYAVEQPGRDDAVWMVTRRDAAAHEIEFVYFVPGIRAGRLNIAVRAADGNRSRVEIRYVNTGLTETGNHVVADAFTGENFDRLMIEWQREMNDFLKARADRIDP